MIEMDECMIAIGYFIEQPTVTITLGSVKEAEDFKADYEIDSEIHLTLGKEV